MRFWRCISDMKKSIDQINVNGLAVNDSEKNRGIISTVISSVHFLTPTFVIVRERYTTFSERSLCPLCLLMLLNLSDKSRCGPDEIRNALLTP